jgi:hypothetical protein
MLDDKILSACIICPVVFNKKEQHVELIRKHNILHWLCHYARNWNQLGTKFMIRLRCYVPCIQPSWPRQLLYYINYYACRLDACLVYIRTKESMKSRRKSKFDYKIFCRSLILVSKKLNLVSLSWHFSWKIIFIIKAYSQEMY